MLQALSHFTKLIAAATAVECRSGDGEPEEDNLLSLHEDFPENSECNNQQSHRNLCRGQVGINVDHDRVSARALSAIATPKSIVAPTTLPVNTHGSRATNAVTKNPAAMFVENSEAVSRTWLGRICKENAIDTTIDRRMKCVNRDEDGSNTDWEWEYMLCPIREVQRSDEVVSLNELMDRGPYLVKLEEKTV